MRLFIMKRTEFKGYSLIFLLLLFLLFSVSTVCAATISLGEVSGFVGEEVTIPVVLNYDTLEPQNICAVSVDICFKNLEDPTVEIGPAAQAADKQVVSNILPNGVLRIGILGLNQNVIDEGPLANISFRISQGASGDIVLMNKASASDPYGNALKISSKNGIVHLKK